MTLRQGTKLAQRQNQRQVLRACQRLAQVLASEVALESEADLADEEAAPSDEPKETYELEDWGISETAIEGESEQTPFDEEATQPLPRLGELPPGIVPRVLFFIDPDFKVHSLLRRKNSRAERLHWGARQAVAEAVAEHLRKNWSSQVPLPQAGEWQSLPAIGVIASSQGSQGAGLKRAFHPQLLELAPSEKRDDLKSVLENHSGFLRAFALMLPNGDVVTPAALVYPARAGKRATRAAALRQMSSRPPTLAGEPWSEKDWNEFERAQNVSARRARRGQSERGA